MARVYQQRRIFDRPQAEVRIAVERAMYQQGMSIKPHGTEWELRASRSMSSLSWGERIKVLLATSPGGGTQVLTESKLVFGFVDWGRNQENVEGLFDAMEDLAGPGRIVPVDP